MSPYKYKYSIIIPNLNGITHLSRCLDSIFKNSKDFEVIVIDNASTDGSYGYLFNLKSEKKNLKVIFNTEAKSFSKSNNQGIMQAEGEYLVFLNNDTQVYSDWLEGMQAHFNNNDNGPVGMVGPVSSMSNGKQMVGHQDGDLWRQNNMGKWTYAGILFGWCLMVPRFIIDKVGGFDENLINSHEDNDLSLRVLLEGYRLIIAFDVYIDHFGQGTLRNMLSMKEYMLSGDSNRKIYYDKWWDDRERKLVAVYRTNNGKYLRDSLAQTSKFADKIIIHFCRANISDLEIEKLKEEFPKIYKVQRYDGIFQEDYERSWLLQEALKLQEAGEADWCISVDDDEIYEDKFIERSKKMMKPRNPEIFGYWCQWRTIWDKRGKDEYFRKDSTFGKFSNYRFFRLIKGMEITSKHPEGHHCGSAPWIAEENLRWSNIRVKHLGYNTHEQRLKKYHFYEANDHFKTKADIGNDDYSHLISKNFELEKYDPDHSISLVMMIKDEQDWIRGCLEHVEPLIDEAVIIDTGSSDDTLKIVSEFAERAQIPVKVISYDWCDNYSIPRNFGLLQAKGKWILHLDADERFDFGQLCNLFEMSESEADLIIFHILNYLRKPVKGKIPEYASTQSVRMFRRRDDFFYSGIVHETLDDCLWAVKKKKKINVLYPPKHLILHHYGYLRGGKRTDKKLEYYVKLNENQMKITGDTDPRPHFNIALHLLDEGKEKEAAQELQKALKIKPDFWHANQQMFTMNINSAKEFLRRTIEHIPSNHPFRGQAHEMLEYLDKHVKGFIKTSKEEDINAGTW